MAGRIRWNGRLAGHKLRKLYENDAAAIHDMELLDNVAATFYARCVSIEAVTRAHHGDVTCARCLASIKRLKWDKAEVLTCPDCGWKTDWGTYFQSYQRRQLYGGGAQPEYWKFLEDFPAAKGYTQKLQVVDRLVHAFHVDLKRASVGRPAAINLIEGSMTTTLKLLDQLASSEASTRGVSQARAEWDETIAKVPWIKNHDFRDEA